MNIGDRIKLIRSNKSQRDFANSLTTSTQTLGRWERRERQPDCVDLNRILEVYPEINPAWLLTGEGEMKRGEEGKKVGETLDEAHSEDAILLNEPFLTRMIQTYFEVFLKVSPENAAREADSIVNIYCLFVGSFVDEVPDIEECKRIMKIIINTTEKLYAGNMKIDSNEFGKLLIKGLHRHQ